MNVIPFDKIMKYVMFIKKKSYILLKVYNYYSIFIVHAEYCTVNHSVAVLTPTATMGVHTLHIDSMTLIM